MDSIGTEQAVRKKMYPSSIMNAWVRMHRCRQCGKRFAISAIGQKWGYFVREYGKKKYFCSYSCMRRFEVPRLKKAQEKMDREFEKVRKMKKEDLEEDEEERTAG